MLYTYFPYEKFTDIEKYFNSEKNLMYMPTSSRDFLLIKSRAKYVYRISESIEYALYLLNCNEEKNRNVAIKIITEVLKYQNINKNSQYYGYWRYFMEVPVEQMLQHESFRKPFHNSVICMALLQIFQGFKESLPQDLIDSIRDAILRTTLTYSSEYTNFLPIEVLHYAYTALISGEIFNKPDLTKYSEQILQNLYTRSKYQNSLAEHNVLFNFENITRILSLLINSAKRTTCVNMAKEMNDMLWKDLATHFHYPTMQIAGPHSKANTFFVDKSFHTFLYYALNEKVNLPHISHKFGELAHCPSKYIPYFSGEKNIEYSQQLVSYGMSFPFFRFSSVATAYIKPSYTFSSFNREFFWNTRHPFIGYFGNYASNNVYCFKLDVLHDFHCYASAALHSIQHYGNALGHITFLTDKGDQHIVYDSHGGIIEAKDFRVRFSIFGKIDDLEITHQKDSLKVTYQDTTIYYNIPYVQFDGYNVTYRFSQEDGAMYFDAIIYSGEKKKINFHELQKAVLEFTFLITSSGKLPCAPINTLQKNILTSKLSADDVVMTLQTPVNPDIETTAFTHDKQMINDIIIEDYALQLNSHIENYTFIEKKIQQQPLALAYPILTDEKELSDKIDQISLDFEKLSSNVQDTLSLISASNFSFAPKKKLALQIIFNIFECAKNDDFRFNEIIDKKHYGIFQKITVAENFPTIEKHILKLCKTLENSKKAFEKQFDGKNKNIINNMISISRENLLNPDLSLTFVAETMGYSVSHLSRVFLESTKTNYVTFLQQEKLNYALSQLKNKNVSVKEVSEKLGYANPTAFTRMVKKMTGLSVTQILKNSIY